MSSQRPYSSASRSVVGVRHGRLTRRHPLFSALKFPGISLVVLAVAAVSVVATDAQRIAAGLKTFELPNETIGPPPDIAAMEGGFNILIVGSDKGETPEEIKDRGKAELNDVTMILHVSQDHTNAVAVDSRAADQERLSAGAGKQSSGFEVQKQQRSGKRDGGPGARHGGQRVPTFFDRLDDVANAPSAVPVVGAVFAVDEDDGAFGPFDDGPTESRCCAGRSEGLGGARRSEGDGFSRRRLRTL